jgi:ATP-dependent DNA helicase RecQ
MAAALDGHDVLAVMPTGSGKSAIYQVPALMADGPTIVVSPLISLQRDQVEVLTAAGQRAVLINSTLSPAEQEEALHDDSARFLFLAPEQLAKDDVIEALARLHPAFFVVDEAHCICSWGHDFRPDYLRLGEAVRRLGRPPIIALTATASPPIRAEIVERLGMPEPVQVVQGFDRPGLELIVEQAFDDEPRREAVVLRAMGEAKPGIVYTATRASSERYATAMADLGLAAAAYHAGLKAADREEVQQQFMDGDLDVVVATTAFGMGIDKADVRFVVHAEVADSIDSYYQEIGRAGRDGKPARAILFYREADLGLRKFFASGRADDEALTRAAVLVKHAPDPVEPKALAQEMGVSQTRVTSLVNLLQQAEAIEVLPDGRIAGDPEPQAAAARAAEVAEQHRLVERSRIEMMRGYAETTGCRRQYLLAYFGGQLEHPCGNCDSCHEGTAGPTSDGLDSPFELQSVVEHAEWGRGVVMRFEGDRVTVLFDNVGYRTLHLDTVVSRGLLRHVSPA